MRTVCGLHMGVSEVWVEGHVPGWGPHAASTGPRVGPHVPRVGGSRQNVASRTRGLTREAPGVPEGGGPWGYNLADISAVRIMMRSR